MFTGRMAQTAKHEAIHASMLWVLLGPDAVGSVTREASGCHLGTTQLGNLPMFRHPALNAFDLATALMAPLVSGGVAADGCDEDLRKAYDLAGVAYPYRPEHERGADAAEWADRWVRSAGDRAKALANGGLLIRARGAVERALDGEPTLSANRVREVLGRAELEYAEQFAAEWAKAKRELRS